jgi:hypothetical protein
MTANTVPLEGNQVMAALILVVLVFVLQQLTEWFPSKCCCGVFSAISCIC